jgi:hypothetical protein
MIKAPLAGPERKKIRQEEALYRAGKVLALDK